MITDHILELEVDQVLAVKDSVGAEYVILKAVVPLVVEAQASEDAEVADRVVRRQVPASLGCGLLNLTDAAGANRVRVELLHFRFVVVVREVPVGGAAQPLGVGRYHDIDTMSVGVKVVGEEPELSQIAGARDIVRDQLVNLLLSQLDLRGQVDAIFYVNVVVVDSDLEVAQSGVDTSGEVSGLFWVQLSSTKCQCDWVCRRDRAVVNQRGYAVDVSQLGRCVRRVGLTWRRAP